jgi:hypothetical protein
MISKTANNMVLVKPVHKDIMRKLPGTDLVLGVPTHAKDQYLKNYAHRHFEVVMAPEKLVIPNSRRLLNAQGAAITWHTECEIKSGDMVWVQLKAGQSAHKVQFDDDPEVYFLINYSSMFVAQRRRTHVEWGKKVENVIKKDEVLWDVIPLNGYIICETVEAQKPKTNLILPEIKKEYDPRLRVKYVGKPAKYYLGLNDIGHFYKKKGDTTKFKSGDLIYPRQSGMPGSRFWINIEGEYFHDFNGVNQLVAIERRFIMAYDN